MTIIEGVPTFSVPPTRNVNIDMAGTAIADIQHPDYQSKINDWELWRLTYAGGQAFIDEYLKKFSKRETQSMFDLRKSVTPIPAFAKAAINDIKNAIYQRTTDITREGGPATYQNSCNGQIGGVDLSSGKMNWFVGNKIIPELLTMGKVGVCVDMPSLPGPTVADKGDLHPYLYTYKAEDIRNWVTEPNGEFASLLLRSYEPIIDPITKLPKGTQKLFKLFYKVKGLVNYQVFNAKSELLRTVSLQIRRIPFVVFEISDSLLSDVARHQIALLNLESSDIGYSLLANFPFYVEQVDPTAANSHLKNAQILPDDPTCTIQEEEGIEVGTTNGRRYGKGLNEPAFINPSTEPLKASIEKQDQLKNDIRLLVNLSLSNIQPKMASAESKTLDQHGLESGLSYIGLELEHGETKIAQMWSMYEGTSTVATINYPRRYSLKSDQERQEEAERLSKQLHRVPSLNYKKQIVKQIVIIMVGDKISNTDLNQIFTDIDNAKFIVNDPDELLTLVKEGLISKALAAKTLFIPDDQVDIANAEHAERLKRIAISQSQGAAAELKDPAARGIKDLS